MRDIRVYKPGFSKKPVMLKVKYFFKNFKERM
jgi:hypothetical protein